MLVVAANYRKCADAVQSIIGTVSCSDFVEAPAPVDQEELILSDNVLTLDGARKLLEVQPLPDADEPNFVPVNYNDRGDEGDVIAQAVAASGHEFGEADDTKV
jgi:hypothetical protein